MKIKTTFASFSAPDLKKEEGFYSKTLGLKAELGPMGLSLSLPGGAGTFIYEKKDHKPAAFTVLNFTVDNIDEAVDELGKKGVKFERYPSMPADEKGIVRGRSQKMGPDIAWFEDPAGNILSVLQE